VAQQLVKRLFLLDGIGALISAVMLGVVLVHLQAYVGIPATSLYFLAALPCVFAAFDFYCYLYVQQGLASCLRTIAIVNLLYCVLSVGIALYHLEMITLLGWIYIIVEIIIVVALSLFELQVARRSSSQ